jgi:hypothetical protein
VTGKSFLLIRTPKLCYNSRNLDNSASGGPLGLRLAALFAALCLQVGVVTTAAMASAQTQVSPKEVTVYATRTGSKYHRSDCRHLSKSKIPISLEEAAERYGPCSVCRPPTIGQNSQSLVTPTKPPSSISEPRQSSPSSVLCQATTKKGTQCSRKAQPGRAYCWQH